MDAFLATNLIAGKITWQQVEQGFPKKVTTIKAILKERGYKVLKGRVVKA